MERALLLFALLTLTSAAGLAQEKGVDTQNDRIRDHGSNRAPAINGRNQNVGTGRGIDFGKGRTPAPPVIANPYRMTARRDVVIRAVQELMRERGMVVDTASSRLDEGVVVSQPFRFVRGAVVARTELNHYAELADADRGWTQGRYTLIVEVQALDATSTSLAVNAKVEGRSDGAAGAEWVSLPSSGAAEQEFIVALVEKVTGVSPLERSNQPPQP